MKPRPELRIDLVELRDFRSHRRLSLEPGSVLTAIVGPNASGKTNILEAIALTTSGDSFRTNKWEELITHGEQRSVVKMEAKAADGSRLEVVMSVEGSRRSYGIDGKSNKRPSDLMGRLPSVSFTPDHLSMVKGPAEERRAAIDTVGGRLSNGFRKLVGEYQRTLRQRNALLRESGFEKRELEAWTDRLVDHGARLAIHRNSLLRRMEKHSMDVHAEVSVGERLSIGYEDSYGVGRDRWVEGADEEEVSSLMRKRLKEREKDESERRMTLVGPHRDDVVFDIGGADARRFASQGQQRSVVLGWKIAEVRVTEEVIGRRPVLLLDDVMSELDERRREALTAHLSEGIQTFMTATSEQYFSEELLSKASVVRTG